MLLFIRSALGYDMGPGARPVILPVSAPRNRAREYLKITHQIEPITETATTKDLVERRYHYDPTFL